MHTNSPIKSPLFLRLQRAKNRNFLKYHPSKDVWKRCLNISPTKSMCWSLSERSRIKRKNALKTKCERPCFERKKEPLKKNWAKMKLNLGVWEMRRPKSFRCTRKKLRNQECQLMLK